MRHFIYKPFIDIFKQIIHVCVHCFDKYNELSSEAQLWLYRLDNKQKSVHITKSYWRTLTSIKIKRVEDGLTKTKREHIIFTNKAVVTKECAQVDNIL